MNLWRKGLKVSWRKFKYRKIIKEKNIKKQLSSRIETESALNAKKHRFTKKNIRFIV